MPEQKKYLRMTLRLFTLAAGFALAVATYAAPPEKYSMAYRDTVRTYSMYLPPSIAEGAPLVVYAHGYSL